MPDLIEKANCMMNKCIQNKKDLGEKIIHNMKKKCEEKNSCKKSNQNKEDNEENIKVEKITKQIEIEETEQE